MYKQKNRNEPDSLVASEEEISVPEPQQDTNASEMGYNEQIEESKHTDSFEACEETEIQEMSCSVPCELANDSDQTMETTTS